MSLVGLDTNILIYAANRAGDPEKYRSASRLLLRLTQQRRGVVALQTLGEFYNAATRKQLTTSVDASALVDIWSAAFQVRRSTLADLQAAMTAHRNHHVPFWDAMIWSVVRRAGCPVLLTEDFQDGRQLAGVTFRNPFLTTNDPEIEALIGSLH